MRYSDFFLQEFLPHIESKYRIRPGRANRAISGISMGGYGALRFAFAHPEMFSAVSAQSAALITESPQELDTAAHSGAPLGEVAGRSLRKPDRRRRTGTTTVHSFWRKETHAALQKAGHLFQLRPG